MCKDVVTQRALLHLRRSAVRLIAVHRVHSTLLRLHEPHLSAIRPQFCFLHSVSAAVWVTPGSGLYSVSDSGLYYHFPCLPIISSDKVQYILPHVVASTFLAVFINRVRGGDKEVVLCPRERHIKHIQVIDPHVQVLLLAVRRIVRQFHLRAVLDGHKIFLSVRLTPDLRLMPPGFFSPRAERHEQSLRLQTLARMNRQDADGVGGRSRNGFRVHRVVPVFEELLYITPVRAHVRTCPV